MSNITDEITQIRLCLMIPKGFDLTLYYSEMHRSLCVALTNLESGEDITERFNGFDYRGMNAKLIKDIQHWTDRAINPNLEAFKHIKF